MTIREELLKIGFTDEYVDQRAKETYDRIVNLLGKNKKSFKDTKIYRVLSMDTVADWLIYKAVQYYQRKIEKNKEIPEFTGDRNNPIDVYEYNSKVGIKPIKTIDNKDGSYTHTYEDGTVVTVRVTLSGFVSEEFMQRAERDRKRLLADYLKIEEEELINMNDEEIETLVKKNEFNKKLTKVLRLGNRVHKKRED